MEILLGYVALLFFGFACLFAAMYHAERANRIETEHERDAWISNACRARTELEGIKRKRNNVLMFPEGTALIS